MFFSPSDETRRHKKRTKHFRGKALPGLLASNASIVHLWKCTLFVSLFVVVLIQEFSKVANWALFKSLSPFNYRAQFSLLKSGNCNLVIVFEPICMFLMLNAFFANFSHRLSLLEDKQSSLVVFSAEL